MFKVTNNEITRYTLPDGKIYEYDVDLFAKILYGRIYNKEGHVIAKARQVLCPWTKILTPEQMYHVAMEKL